MISKKNKSLKTKLLSDARGEIYLNKIKETEFNLVLTTAGSYRAGHYHSAEQYNIILKGKIKITLRQNNQDIVKNYGPNELIVIPSDTPHLYKFLKETVMIEWLKGRYRPRFYQPYRKIIDKN